jgi:serine phosphatase RsbU (regulator of sigma subunit)
VGDIGGHGMEAAATMAQVRSMLRALMFDHHDSPGMVLANLDRTLETVTDAALSTACLARLNRTAAGGSLYWSTAGHPPPLLLEPGKPGRYLQAEPGLPLGVAPGEVRPNQRDRLPPGATVIFFTDGLVEHRGHSIDEGLGILAGLATRHAGQSIERLCDALVENHPGDDSDDIAILALRLPA